MMSVIDVAIRLIDAVIRILNRLKKSIQRGTDDEGSRIDGKGDILVHTCTIRCVDGEFRVEYDDRRVEDVDNTIKEILVAHESKED